MNIITKTTRFSPAFYLLGLFCFPAQAALKCANGDGSATLIDLSNRVKVTPGTPVGTTLFSQTFTGLKAKCSLTTATGSAETAYFSRPNLSTALGGGLTLFVTYKGNRNSTAANISTGVMVSDRSAFLGLASSFWQEVSLDPVTVEIVKTGTTGATSASANITIGSVGSTLQTSDKAIFYLRGANTISYMAETCTVPTPASFDVSLGSVGVSSSGFGSGVGSTSAAKDFSINLSCDTGVSGAFKVMMQLDGTPVSGLENQGVLALTNSGASGVAGGVGVQVLNKANSTPVSFAKPWQVGAYPISASLITVPFSARYYQTAASVTPGTANSSMTYTISYQ
ncbi:fimbrial protein [Enterobacter cloacae]|uniref:fimbrial protein n=1 Tax=Enterobacter cloacae TaxID=550 RepID=UPI0034A25C9F